MIEIENLKFRYEEDSKIVLDDINLTIPSGQFVSILGRNGSGKSTLAKLLNAQILPTEGSVKVFGNDTKDVDAFNIREKVGMVFQNPDNQIVATIVEEDVAFGPENLGIPNPELRNRVDDSLKAVDMYEHRLDAPHMLSGGQKQRVAIAGVPAMKPEIIVFDEPTAMLDPTGRNDVMEQAVKLNKEENKTIINITHYMNEAVISDRVVVINEGKIVLDGTPKEVFSKVDLIRQYGLDVPQVTELAFMLKNNGVNISSEILTIDELVNAL